MSSAADPAFLRDVLLRTADEARHLHEGLAGLDACLGGALGRLPADVLACLQQTDLLRQEAEGLSNFLQQLACDVKGAETCDSAPALAALLLQDQQARLSGIKSGPTSETESEIWTSLPTEGGR